ncbi:glycosyltransferase family 2 protein [Limnohabitans sp.]|uniref:glycosyltransferase family 2 protein n=1 Tax=Limnohabitans sp. TaxID=1907725 RepID=UPI0026021473|nr:glycosyltransferase family 2 protein [Limnohabitans sp.]
MPYQPTVHILLATYNGANYLQAQLQSIARQTHSQWTLTVSDDGSTDETVNIVKTFAQNSPQTVTLLQGPCEGSSTRNFCHLVQHAPANTKQDLYAFCDQDDVWLDTKLERAVQWHAQHLQQPVRLYCGRTQFVNEQLKPIGLSPGIRRPPSFGNALVQNIASGNTMVLNPAVLAAQKKVQPEHSVWHDWTTYLVATALGGEVWFDDEPCLLYRQHGGNVIGSNNGLSAQIRRLKPLFEGRFKQWTDANMAAVLDVGPAASEAAQELHQKFAQLRVERFPWKRFCSWQGTAIRRQTTSSNLTLGLALALQLS